MQPMLSYIKNIVKEILLKEKWFNYNILTVFGLEKA